MTNTHRQRVAQQELDYRIALLWHNSFGEALGEPGAQLSAAIDHDGTVEQATIDALPLVSQRFTLQRDGHALAAAAAPGAGKMLIDCVGVA